MKLVSRVSAPAAPVFPLQGRGSVQDGRFRENRLSLPGRQRPTTPTGACNGSADASVSLLQVVEKSADCYRGVVLTSVRNSRIGSNNALWALTCYFNPCHYRRRLANYRVFRESLSLPLITVELGYGQHFELTEGDAEILIQLEGRAVMWQKERLLNIAFQRVPVECKYVIWVDSDIIFDTSDWPELVIKSLERFPVVQPYSRVHDLPRNWGGEQRSPKPAEFTRQGVAFAIASGMSMGTCVGEPFRNGSFQYSRGFAWAARREVLDRHGLYDACIIGSGDTAFTCAIYGCHELVMNIHCMNDEQRAYYRQWAENLHCSVLGSVGFIEADIYHLWHGEIRDRAYRDRHKGLERFRFDPFSDIALCHNGSWIWNTHKPEMHEYVERYFFNRREDG